MGNRHCHAIRGTDDSKSRIELPRERVHEGDTETILPNWISGSSHTIVRDNKPPVRSGGFIMDNHLGIWVTLWKSVLERVDEKLGHDQTDADGVGRFNGAFVSDDFDRDRVVRIDHGVGKTVAQILQIRTKLDQSTTSSHLNKPLHFGDRDESLMGFPEMLPRLA